MYIMAYKKAKQMPDNNGKTYATRKAMNVKAEIFAQVFLNPTSKTFMNVLQSALRAGYSETYAENISVQRPKWWVELTETADYRRAQMLAIAEKNLLDTVASTSDDRDDRKIKHDATKFVSERLGKQHYSTRQEITGADGRRLFTNEQRATAKTPVASLFKGVKAQ